MIFVTPAILSTIKQDPLSSFAMKTLSSSGVDLFRPNNLCDLGTYSIFTGHISDPWARLVSRNKNLWLHLPAHTHHHLGGWGGGDVNRVRKHHQFIPEAEARIAEVMHVSVTVGCHQSCTDSCRPWDCTEFTASSKEASLGSETLPGWALGPKKFRKTLNKINISET